MFVSSINVFNCCLSGVIHEIWKKWVWPIVIHSLSGQVQTTDLWRWQSWYCTSDYTPSTNLGKRLIGKMYTYISNLEEMGWKASTCKQTDGDHLKLHDGGLGLRQKRVVTTVFIDFSDAQGQLTLKSVMESCRNSNLTKLLLLSLLPARMKKLHPKMKALEWSQHFSHYKSMGIFPESMAANSSVPGQIFLNFEPMRDFIVVLITCKYKEEPIKNEGAGVVTRFSPL